MQRLGVKRFTNSVIAELNRVYEDEASTSFTDSLVRTKSSGLEKKSKKDKRKERVRVQKELTKVVNEHFAESAAISMLTSVNPSENITASAWPIHLRSNHQQKRQKSILLISPT